MRAFKIYRPKHQKRKEKKEVYLLESKSFPELCKIKNFYIRINININFIFWDIFKLIQFLDIRSSEFFKIKNPNKGILFILAFYIYSCKCVCIHILTTGSFEI